MKKLIFLLCLSLCLNGTLALASEVETGDPADAETGDVVATETGEAAAQDGDENVEAAAEAGEATGDGADGAVQEATGDEAGDPAGENTGVADNAVGEAEDEAKGDANDQDAEGPAAGEEAPANGEATPNDDAPTDGTTPGDAPAPTDEETAGPEAQAGIPEDAEAWFERDGAKIGGSLEAVVPQLTGGETLNIVTKNIKGVARVQDVPLKKLSDVTLKLDPEDKSMTIRVSRDDPADAEQPEAIELKALAECGDDERGALFFWIEPAKAAEPEPTEAPAPVLSVAAEGYTPAAWSSAMPAFTLSGIPEGGGYSYAAIVYDERIVPLSADSYVPEEEGKYTVRFAMLDSIGDIVGASETYLLWLDATAPERVTVETDETQSYTLRITAEDGLSGVAGVSLDGGATWATLANGETYTYTGTEAVTFSAGAI
ncbi:MAG: hypothetical protein IJ769_05010, partial [Clostridia bacterium]|nr:hypothetical protein [Clostridia bacterium]